MCNQLDAPAALRPRPPSLPGGNNLRYQLETFFEKKKILLVLWIEPQMFQSTAYSSYSSVVKRGKKTYQYLKKLDRAVRSGSASPLPSMLFASCSNSAGSMLISVMYAEHKHTDPHLWGQDLSTHNTSQTNPVRRVQGIATTDEFGRRSHSDTAVRSSRTLSFFCN